MSCIINENNMKKDIEYVNVNDIKIWERNVKKHTDKNIKQLAKIIEIYGQQTPITVWRKDKQIRKGNGTYLAITKILKWKNIWVKWIDFNNKSEADLYGIADNKSNEWSEIDDNKLREIFTDNDIIDFTKSKDQLKNFTGFSDKDIDLLFEEKDIKQINNKNEKSTIKIECSREDKFELLKIIPEFLEEFGYTNISIL